MKRSVENLWQDYLFITREMLKFVSRREMDMFYLLVEQREQLQQKLETEPDNGFRQSADGQELLRRIAPLNRAITERLQFVYNQTSRQQEISQSYEGVATRAGGQVDFQS